MDFAERRNLTILLVIGLACVAFVAWSPQQSQQPLHYSAYVVAQKVDERTDYNWVNIIKDSAITAGASAAVAACAAESLGACVAAIPSVASAVGSMANDEIISEQAEINLTNTGNGTATDIRCAVNVYVDNQLLKTYDLPVAASIHPGSSYLVPISYNITFSDLAASALTRIRGGGKVNLTIASLTYDSGSP